MTHLESSTFAHLLDLSCMLAASSGEGCYCIDETRLRDLTAGSLVCSLETLRNLVSSSGQVTTEKRTWLGYTLGSAHFCGFALASTSGASPEILLEIKRVKRRLPAHMTSFLARLGLSGSRSFRMLRRRLATLDKMKC